MLPINGASNDTPEKNDLKISADALDKSATQFAKSDNGKLRISLVPTQIVRDVAEVRMYGDNKYHAPNNWALVEMDRYVDALMRHLLAFLDDPNSIDEESGIPHYKHAACNMAFICAMMDKNWDTLKKHLIETDPYLQSQMRDYIEKAKSKSKESEN